MNVVAQVRMDKNVVVLQAQEEEAGQKAYWASRTPEERLQALEMMRQIAYGYDPTTTRLQRILEVIPQA